MKPTKRPVKSKEKAKERAKQVALDPEKILAWLTPVRASLPNKSKHKKSKKKKI